MERKKLGKICKLRQGFQVPLPYQVLENKPGYVRFIRIVDYTQKTEDVRYIKNNDKYYYVEPDDVVMIRYGAAGVVGRGITGVIANNMFLVDPIISINKSYLYYYLSWSKIRDSLLTASTSTTMPALNFKTVNNLEIPLYDPQKQNDIVMVLDQITKIIDFQRKELLLFDDLIKARFVEMFGDPEINDKKWDEACIGDNCFVTKLAGFEYTNYIHYQESGDVVMVKAQNVKNGKLNRKDLSFISNEVSDSLPRSQLAPGDVVMTYVGANIGDVAIIDDEYKYHLAPNVAKIRPNAEIYNSIFFMHLLMMKTDYIMRNSADTAKAALGMERIRKLKVFVPDIALQIEFSNFAKQVDKSKFVVQKSLDEAQLLFDSLMQKYFG